VSYQTARFMKQLMDSVLWKAWYILSMLYTAPAMELHAQAPTLPVNDTEYTAETYNATASATPSNDDVSCVCVREGGRGRERERGRAASQKARKDGRTHVFTYASVSTPPGEHEGGHHRRVCRETNHPHVFV
jgi:hypothetical protein